MPVLERNIEKLLRQINYVSVSSFFTYIPQRSFSFHFCYLMDSSSSESIMSLRDSLHKNSFFKTVKWCYSVYIYSCSKVLPLCLPAVHSLVTIIWDNEDLWSPRIIQVFLLSDFSSLDVFAVHSFVHTVLGRSGCPSLQSSLVRH